MAEASGGLFGPLDGETADLSQWDSTVESGTNTFSTQAAAANNGSYGFRVLYAGSSGTAYGQIGFTPSDTEWFRWYVYIPSTFNTNAQYIILLHAHLLDGGTHVAQVGFGSWDAGTVPDRWALRWQYSYQYSTTNFSTNAWHMVELKYVRHATTGGVELWVDGDQLLTDIDQDTSSYYPDTFRLGDVDGSRSPDNGDYFYIDDVLGDTSQIGAYSDVGSSGNPWYYYMQI